MFTRCPGCQTAFRLRAAQLARAQGRVRCGQCGQAFNALQSLADTPAGLPAVAAPMPEDKLVPGTGAARAGEPAPALHDLPDWDEPARPRRRWLWWLLAVVLLLLVLVQTAWFQRDRLYTRFPQLLPLAEQLCERLECEVYRLRHMLDFELINRDVRMHPAYEDALLVNATFANRAAQRQPYPQLQLALYDTDGRVIAYRAFKPADYLDASLPTGHGMAPDEPLHVVLEVSGPTSGAVSFEFGFL